MKTHIAIKGIGVVGGFGSGVSDFREALGGKRSHPSKVPGRPGGAPADLSVFMADTSKLDRYVPPKELRRIDHYSQMAILGAHLAVEDAGVHPKDLDRLGVVIATGYGPTRSMFRFIDSSLDDGIACASPSHFAASVHITASAYIAMKLGVDCTDHVVSQFEMSVPSALMTACGWLAEGRLDHVLLGGVDEYCDLLGYSWHRFFGKTAMDEIRPLDLGEQSAVIGEGAAFLLLTRQTGQAGYAVINEADLVFRSERSTSPIHPEAVLLLGADGHKECGSEYRRLAGLERDVVCYTPHYGSIPIGFGFQLAAAALMVKEEKIFATPGPLPAESLFHVISREQSLNARPVCCLLHGTEGGLAMATLGNS